MKHVCGSHVVKSQSYMHTARCAGEQLSLNVCCMWTVRVHGGGGHSQVWNIGPQTLYVEQQILGPMLLTTCALYIPNGCSPPISKWGALRGHFKTFFYDGLEPYWGLGDLVRRGA